MVCARFKLDPDYKRKGMCGIEKPLVVFTSEEVIIIKIVEIFDFMSYTEETVFKWLYKTGTEKHFILRKVLKVFFFNPTRPIIF